MKYQEYEYQFEKRFIIFEDAKTRETIAVYPNQLVPDLYVPCGCWLCDFIEKVLNLDSDSLLAFDNQAVIKMYGQLTKACIVRLDLDCGKGETHERI